VSHSNGGGAGSLELAAAETAGAESSGKTRQSAVSSAFGAEHSGQLLLAPRPATQRGQKRWQQRVKSASPAGSTSAAPAPPSGALQKPQRDSCEGTGSAASSSIACI